MSCKIDKHPRRQQIDADMVAGVPYRTIIAKYPGQKIATGTLSRHTECVKKDMSLAIKQRESERSEHGTSLLNRVENLIGECESVLAAAKKEADWKSCMNAIAGFTRLLELVGKLDGSLQTSTSTAYHLTVQSGNRNTDFSGSDLELAQAVQESTDNFNPDVIERMKALLAEPVIQV